MKYFGLDGDSIGRHIELLLIQNKVHEVKEFSENIVKSLEKIKNEVLLNEGDIIFCSGDSILFCGSFDSNFSNKILQEFYEQTGRTASMGIGSNMAKTYLGLKLAKAKGGNQFVDYSEIENK